MSYAEVDGTRVNLGKYKEVYIGGLFASAITYDLRLWCKYMSFFQVRFDELGGESLLHLADMPVRWSEIKNRPVLKKEMSCWNWRGYEKGTDAEVTFKLNTAIKAGGVAYTKYSKEVLSGCENMPEHLSSHIKTNVLERRFGPEPDSDTRIRYLQALQIGWEHARFESMSKKDKEIKA